MTYCRAIVFILIVLPALADAQTLSLVSHFPESAYVANRLLPFSVRESNSSSFFSFESAANGGVAVGKVDIINGQSCSAAIDPYYPDTFHLFCRVAEVVDVFVHVQTATGAKIYLRLNSLSIASQRAPPDGFTAAQNIEAEEPGDTR